MPHSSTLTTYPVITLMQPWATWIVWGYKTIETRTHPRFAALAGRTVLIHAGLRTDMKAFDQCYLPALRTLQPLPADHKGAIIGAVDVLAFGRLKPSDAEEALIECNTPRWGLYLDNPRTFKHSMPMRGKLGIWRYDLGQPLATVICR